MEFVCVEVGTPEFSLLGISEVAPEASQGLGEGASIGKSLQESLPKAIYPKG